MIGATAATAFIVALATGVAPARGDDAACRAEIAKLCPDMKPGDGKYGQCLVDHAKDFSAPCKKYSDAAAARKRDLKQLPSCIADAEKLCPGIKVGVTNLTKCLRTHQSDLSSECRDELGKRTGGKYR
jgi:hypothetical protein